MYNEITGNTRFYSLLKGFYHVTYYYHRHCRFWSERYTHHPVHG